MGLGVPPEALPNDCRIVAVLAPTVVEIEEAFVGHWSHFGRWPKGALIEDCGTLRFETPIPQLPHNAVIHTRIPTGADAVVDRLVARFQARNVGFVWVDHPSARPSDLGRRLEAARLPVVEHATGMALELSNSVPPEPTDDIRYTEVLNEASMQAYTELIFEYWQVPQASRNLVADMNRNWTPDRTAVHRWVAYDGDHPVGKVLLSRWPRQGASPRSTE